MKKTIVMLAVILLSSLINANAQTSTSSRDYLGRINTTYSDQYGQTSGYSTTSKDYLGRNNTTYENSYGQTIGYSTGSTDYIGRYNTTCQK